MADIKELIEAVGLIRNECMEHKCCDCPLNGITCDTGLYYPAGWNFDKLRIDAIGVKDDDESEDKK